MAEFVTRTPLSEACETIAAGEHLPTTPVTVSAGHLVAAAVSSATKTSRFSRGSGQEKALLAVRVLHSPGTKKHFKTKSAAATAYGVSPQPFAFYEKEMIETGVLSSAANGTIPAPDLPVTFLSVK